MTLASGTRFGNYEILSPLGAGGMGEVYRARDLRLDRVVAIKSLPAGLTADPERLARFEREARLLASLNHPNIATIHGIEDLGATGGGSCLVLEFIEGETLAQRIARGALPVRETLEVAGQIAAAIESAHERGIVHRDLKPGNVMLTASRAVKVLDFGLAKDTDPVAPGSGPLSASPTVAMTATTPGVILGTAPYMSPEQARGKAADRRTDVWAFGCIVMECLTGRPTFSGETVSDVIARILERDPDWSSIPASTPQRLRDLIRRCLTKEAAERPRDIGDLRRELSAISLDLSSGPRAPSSATEVPSLAVLYFENLAKDPESDYFCSGVTEDIVTDLSKIKGLKVASRNAVLRYRGAPADPQKVGSELGVRAVLEGSVRRAGDRVRITVQLVNAADGFQLWAERYDRKLDDIFGVQEEIASSIAAALRVALTPADVEKLAADRPNDARAYDLYLKARQRYGQYSADSLKEALELFHQAIAVDANYARAWAGVADCHGQMVQWGFEAHEDGIRLGLEAARRATTIDPGLADGYKAEGLVLRIADDVEGSRAALVRAVQADPNHTPAIINLAVHAVTRADLAGAERLIRRTLEIDPQEPFATSWLVLLTRWTRRFDECETLIDRLRRLSDDPFYVTAVYSLRARLAVDRGDLASAAATLAASRADHCRPQDIAAAEALVAVNEGRLEKARQILHEIGQKPLMGESILAAAVAAVRLGDVERALELINRELMRDMMPCVARLERELHPLLDHRPFAPRRWNATMVWPLEAPMIDPACHSVFHEVKIESGRPQGSDILRGLA